MFNNYLRSAWRNLLKNKVSAFINIGGLAVGMAVTILIGLWIWDELSFNKYHKNYEHIARVMQHAIANGGTGTQANLPYIVGDELRSKHGSDFKYIVMSTAPDNHILTVGDRRLREKGRYMEPGAPDMLTLTMLEGKHSALKDPASILLSSSAARALFGNANPMNQLVKIDNTQAVKVAGVYEDIPNNSEFRDLSFIASWQLYLSTVKWIREMPDPWGWNAWYTYVQMADHAGMETVSKKIINLKQANINPNDKTYRWEVFLDPMRNWHLYSEFINGVRTGGLIRFVWLFGMIGAFVLLLACINFMNLSTARSERRAREVGIRKAIGSLRKQLIYQFFTESLLIVFFSFFLSLLLAQLTLPFFNQVAGKQIAIPSGNPLFWILGICFCGLTAIISGSYPAFYLSSFQPVKVLKGTFRVGRFASIPRKVLVVMQFSVSVILIIGTIVVFRQIQVAKDRPIGYERDGLIVSQMTNRDIHDNFNAIRAGLINTGAISEMAESSSPTTGVTADYSDISWTGKDPNLVPSIPSTGVTYDYGKTVGWQFTGGRDFSRSFGTDSLALVINETAVRYMSLKDPIGATIHWGETSFHVIGVIRDMLMESPYDPVRASIYHLASGGEYVLLRLNPLHSARQSVNKITTVFSRYSPSIPFDYHFVDDDYATKFGDEQRIGKLSSTFALLAILISCLGLFGMASFMTEQRMREIGIRKTLGATVFGLWVLMSREFVNLVALALLISIPIAHYAMQGWLQHYTYHARLSWWIFAATAAGMVLVTLLTVSYQSIKTALVNPIKSLRTE